MCIRDRDIAVLGEAESSFASLLKAISLKKNLNRVKGIVYKEKNKIKKTKIPKEIDLDNLPFPDKDVFRKSDYVKVKEEINNFGGILSSRGCPGRCTYCYHSLFGKCFRYRSAQSVFKEVLYLYKKYGITHINFIDDAFTINRKRLIELCDLFIQAKLPIEWVCATRIDFLDEEIIFKMKKAGCRVLCLGLESLNPDKLKEMNKKQTPSDIKRAIDVIHKYGIKIHGMFMCDQDEINQDYYHKIGVDSLQLCITTPLPGSKLFEKIKEKNQFIDSLNPFRDYKNWRLFNGLHSLVKNPSPYSLQKHLERTMKKFYSFKSGLKEIFKLNLGNAYMRIIGSKFVRKYIKQNKKEKSYYSIIKSEENKQWI